MIELKPVYFEGEIQLWDIFLNGEWLGSRRLEHLAQAYAEWVRDN